MRGLNSATEEKKRTCTKNARRKVQVEVVPGLGGSHCRSKFGHEQVPDGCRLLAE